MAISVTILDSRLIDRIAKETTTNSTGAHNLVGGAASLYAITVVSADSSNANYVKFYDTSIVGSVSDDPVIILPVAPSGTLRVVVTDGIAFSNGISVRAVQNAGTAGTTNPAGNVSTTIVTG